MHDRSLLGAADVSDDELTAMVGAAWAWSGLPMSSC